MPRRPCLEPGCSAITTASRCPAHAVQPYSYAERQRMRQAVAQYLATHGPWCPGYGVPAHYADDLTADHLLPRSRGGAGGPLGVLCRQCNARKRDGRR